MPDRSPLNRLLETIQQWWSSDDPYTAAKGVAGKLAVEGGGTALLVVVGALIIGGLSTVVPFLEPLRVTPGAIATAAGVFLYLERRVWCNVIRRVDEN